MKTTYERIADTRSQPIGGWRTAVKPSDRQKITLWRIERQKAMARIGSIDKLAPRAGEGAWPMQLLAKRSKLAETVKRLTKLIGDDRPGPPPVTNAGGAPAAAPMVPVQVPRAEPPVPMVPMVPAAPVDLGVPVPSERVHPADVTYPCREGQQQFRSAIIAAYGRCAITGCEDEAVLQAAHVIPYVDVRSNVLRNGICLRADIHCLYDRDLVRIHGDGRVWVDPSVRSYRHLDGTRIDGRLPDAALLD